MKESRQVRRARMRAAARSFYRAQWPWASRAFVRAYAKKYLKTRGDYR